MLCLAPGHLASATGSAAPEARRRRSPCRPTFSLPWSKTAASPSASTRRRRARCRCAAARSPSSSARSTFIRDDTTGVWNFDRKPFTRGENGVWTLTLGPLAPGIYDYMFDVDGLDVADPDNARVVEQPPRRSAGWWRSRGLPGSRGTTSGATVPHGTVDHALVRLEGHRILGAGCTCTRRRGTTPGPPPAIPSSTCSTATRVTTGSGSEIGRANVVADNLVADGKSLPMVIVMPDGHAYRAVPGQRAGREVKEQQFDGRPAARGPAPGGAHLPRDARPRAPRDRRPVHGRRPVAGRRAPSQRSRSPGLAASAPHWDRSSRSSPPRAPPPPRSTNGPASCGSGREKRTTRPG